MTAFQIDSYLDRFGYSGSRDPNLKTLRKLQTAHLLQIPFENLDIHNKIPVKLDIERIFEKVVLRKRGGFCYELNGLFYELLRDLGFNPKRISARVFMDGGNYSPEYDHMAIVADIDGSEYLTDVGFGEFSFEPLKLQAGLLQHDPRGNFMVSEHTDNCLRISKIENGHPKPEYIFRNTAREFEEFDSMCQYHQTNPESNFMKKRLISIPTPNGRITLTGNLLKIKEGDATTERELAQPELSDTAEFNRLLWHNFRVQL